MDKQVLDYLLRCKKRSESEISAFAFTLHEMIYEMKPKVVLEIGVNRGGISTHVILGAMWCIQEDDKDYNGKLYSIDIKDFSFVISEDNKIRKFWTFNKEDSRDFYKTWSSSVDILLIDGAHEDGIPESDLRNYYPFLKSGGYVLIHDTLLCDEVVDLWNKIGREDNINLSWQHGMGIIQKK